MTTKSRVISYAVVAVAFLVIGMWLASKLSCGVVHAVDKPVDSAPVHPISESQPISVVTKYVPDVRFVHVYGIDTVSRDTGSHEVDTVFVTECHYDTCYQQGPPNLTKLMPYQAVLAAFQNGWNQQVLELWAGAEIDLLGGHGLDGYGAQVALKLNLAPLHIADVSLFADAGYLHAAHVSIGVEGKLLGY